MKNNTKVRLHLSKQLFESLTKQILAEAKMKKEALGGYTEVKMPKANKSAEKMTDKMKKMEEMSSKEKMAKGLYKEDQMEEAGAPPIPPLPSVDKANLKSVNIDIKDVATFAKALLDISKKLKGGEGFNPETDPNIKRAMDALRAAAGAPGIPAMPEKKPTKGAPGIPPLKGSRMEEGQLNESEIMQQLQNFLTTQIGSGGDAASVGSILAGLAGVGVSPVIINQLHKWWEKKHPKSFKAAQGISAAMDKQAGNTPGQGHGVDASKTFGPREGVVNEFTGTETESSGAIAMIAAALGMGIPLATALIKDLMKAKTPEEKKQVIQQKLPSKDGGALKEYEQHYEMVNGQCRRYNDEGEYEVVSSHYCR